METLNFIILSLSIDLSEIGIQKKLTDLICKVVSLIVQINFSLTEKTQNLCRNLMKLVYSIFIILSIGLLSRSLLPSNSTSDADFEFDMSDLEIKPQEITSHQDAPETCTPVMSLDYRGEWSSHHMTNQFSEFIQTSGFATFTARKKNSKVVDDYIEFWFYDGQYVDNKALKIAFTYNHDTDFNPQNATFKNSYVEFYAAFYENFNQIKETSSSFLIFSSLKIFASVCSGKYQISFIDKDTQKPYKKVPETDENTEAQIWLESFNCDISIFSRVFATDSVYNSDVMDYSILMTLVCLSHLYACIHMIRSISRNESIAQGYSLLTLATITSWDIYLCLFHLYEAISLDMGLFHYFITPAFWYFILASIFQTKLLTMVWKTRYYRLFETVTDIRRGLASLYFRLYGFMGIFITMSYFYSTEIWFMYLASLFFVPQIVHNAIRGQKVKFDVLYVFFFGFLRFILPLYARGYSYSIFKLTPDSSFVVYYPSILLFQVTALYLQAKLGSRFFVPAYFLPPKHNYFQKIQLLNLQKEDACSICMDNLGHDSSCLKTPMLKIDEKSVIQVMKTPCKHIFHEKCLKDWMDIKLECPYCRTMLPSLDS